MVRKAPRPQSPHHVMIYDEDWDWLVQVYGPRGLQPIGVSTVIRETIHQKVGAMRAKQAQRLDQIGGGRAEVTSPTEEEIEE